MIFNSGRIISLQKIRNFVLFITFIILIGGSGYWFGQHRIEADFSEFKPDVTVINRAQPNRHKDVDFSLFWQVWEELEASYLRPDDIDPEKMVYGAIAGMTSALGDPYTVFLSPSNNKQTRENLSGSFYGVGIQIGFKNRRLAVVAPLDGMPAYSAGVQSGDYIVRIIDEAKSVDKSTQDMTLPEAVSLIRGEKGSSIRLSLFREGAEEPFEVDLVREEIVIPSVNLEFIPPKLGVDEESEQPIVAHLRMSQFGERTKQEWDEAMSEIVTRRADIDGIVLDLRNNPGGFLSGAIEFASDFFTEGTVVVQQGRSQSQTFTAEKRRGRVVGIPVVVLVNEGSASASEILAGALRDRLDTLLIGEQTFGKGTVQEAKDLSSGAGLHVTTAEWVLPSGSKINSVGLSPDIEVVLEDDEEGIDEQLERAIAELIK